MDIEKEIDNVQDEAEAELVPLAEVSFIINESIKHKLVNYNFKLRILRRK
jgi:hypothetical protein